MRFLGFLLLLLFHFNLFGQDNIHYFKVTDDLNRTIINTHIYHLQSDEKLNLSEIIERDDFLKEEAGTMNLGITSSDIWLKIPIVNHSKSSRFILSLEYPIIDEVSFWFFDDQENLIELNYVEHDIFSRLYIDPDYVFEIQLNPGEKKVFYLKLTTTEQAIFPLAISDVNGYNLQKNTRYIINGVYLGVVMIMFLYNFFIYFSTKDRSYLWYVGYLFCVSLTQLWIKGFGPNFISPDFYIDGSFLTIIAAIACFCGVYFTKTFLNTKLKVPKLNTILNILLLPLISSILLVLVNLNQFGFLVMQICTGVFAILILVISYYLVYKKYRPAYYFTAAWTILLFGSIVFLLKDAGVLPYNFYTSYSMQLASGLEMAVLSFALADRINFYRKEKDLAKANEIEALQANEKFVIQQNVILETRVKDRTDELEKLNHELQQTLVDFETSQKELIKSEKMASLGQLTAGVAHEINNPINFVSSNIEPLKRDLNELIELVKLYEGTSSENFQDKIKEIEAYKEQIDYHYLLQELNDIISGIEDGATRTSEIVEGLKTFSRSDSKSKIPGNINEGIKATITLIQSKLDGIELELNLGELPEFLCFPSKLNQVFMNMLSNAIDAVTEQPNRKPPYIKVTTHFDSEKNCVIVQFTDSGCGIPDHLATKIFDPFYTTKPVGKGTGLGLSISYQLIELHDGSLSFESDSEKGTTFTIVLPT